jgi:plastocyanin
MSAPLLGPVAAALGRMIRRGLLIAGGALLALGARAETLEVSVSGAKGAPVADAVVAVFVKGAPVRTTGANAEMGQRNKRFTPPVLAVQTGTTVQFPNQDTVRHHVYSFSPAKAFELKLYIGTPASPVVFDKAGTAALGCNIHDSMTGWVKVVDTPFFGVSDATGLARLELPAGEHRLQVWHPGLGAEVEPPLQVLKVVAGTPTAVAVQLKGL